MSWITQKQDDDDFMKWFIQMLKENDIEIIAFDQYDGYDLYSGTEYTVVRKSDGARFDIDEIAS